MNPRTIVDEQYEVERLYFSVFRKTAPELLKTRFYRASQRIFATVDTRQQSLYKIALKNDWDLEALEIAGRYTGRLPLLSVKIRLIVFLAETLPDHQHFYINDKSNFLLGLTSLIKGFIKSVIKLAKGLYFLRALNNA